MTKFISQKMLYSNFKNVSDQVQAWVTFIVLKYSKPAYKIVPLVDENNDKKKYKLSDLNQFCFSTWDSNLSKSIEKYAYGL